MKASTVYIHALVKSAVSEDMLNRGDYFEGIGRYKDKVVEKELTPDDTRLEQLKLEALEQRRQYLERLGGFEGKNGVEREDALELPVPDSELVLDAGAEGYGASWNQFGIVSARAENEKVASAHPEGRFIDVIITVDRESTDLLSMTSKQDFQNLARTKFGEMVERWGIMEPSDVRWFAEYHTDAARSLHIHATVWDASGRWEGLQNSPKGQTIPHDNLMAANQIIRDEIFKGIRLERSIEKDYLRDRLQLETYRALGALPPADLQRRCLDKAVELYGDRDKALAKVFDAMPDDKELALAKPYLDTVRLTLPDNGRQNARYAYSSEETKDAVNATLRALKEQAGSLRELHATYDGNVVDHAAMRGLSGSSLKNYCHEQTLDIDRRLRNVILRVAGSPVRLPERTLARGNDASREEGINSRILPDYGLSGHDKLGHPTGVPTTTTMPTTPYHYQRPIRPSKGAPDAIGQLLEGVLLAISGDDHVGSARGRAWGRKLREYQQIRDAQNTRQIAR
jgi:hypothetical protein